MSILNKKQPILLFLGDIVILVASLALSLGIRFGTDVSLSLFLGHLQPFGFLFIIWLLVFFIAGLYEKHTLILTSRLPQAVFNAQLANSLIAVVFFYLVPTVGIAPKTILAIYLLVSFLLLLAWRIKAITVFGPRERIRAMVIGSGEEMRELMEEINKAPHYPLEFVASIDLDNMDGIDVQQDVVKRVYGEEISMVVVDLMHQKVEPILPSLYNLIFSKVKFLDLHKVYESVFDRIPLSLVKYNWFLENISLESRFTYDSLKRLMDIAVSLVLGVLSLLVYPFVALAIKLEDKGPIFIVQERIGRNNLPIRIAKFRSMSVNDDGATEADKVSKITKTGAFIRKTRIDELPQLLSVIRGDLSLIGPRPELPALAKKYEESIPYYNVRHLVKPGLSGWAQLYHKNPPKFDVAFDETRMKLSYDLYYIKNRSFILEVKIALRTIATLLSRSGV
jgi:exopolysaccharide biosynthesis polyprenyl glycosylphosphotransferase